MRRSGLRTHSWHLSESEDLDSFVQACHVISGIQTAAYLCDGDVDGSFV